MSPRSLVEVVRARADARPDDAAFGWWGDGEVAAWMTYGELDRRARTIAALLQMTVVPGERALLLYAPGFDYIAAFFGCLYAGIIAVPAYPPDPGRLERTLPRLQAMVHDARAKTVLTTRDVLGMVKVVTRLAPDLGALDWVATDAVSHDLVWRDPNPTSSDVAFLQYTSGSTGSPKGVVLTHANLLANCAAIVRAHGYSPETRQVTWVPPYHDMGLIGSIVQPVVTGHLSVLMSPVSFLMRPLRWLQAITAIGATSSGGPNFAFDLCSAKITDEQKAQLDLSSWRLAYVAAEPVRDDTLARFARAFGRCGFQERAFYPCYGLAESTLIVTGIERGAARTVRAGVLSMGRLVTGGELAIVDPESRRRVPDGEIGEIWVRSDSVAAGYWNRLEESSATFDARTDEDDGPFLRTGDLGFAEAGELFVTGRRKEVIIIRGRKLFPTDLEATVEQVRWDSSHHRAGGCAAFSRTVDGTERLFLAIEVERRQAERRSAAQPSVERRGSDRRARPHSYRGRAAVDDSATFDPESVVRTVRAAVAAEHGVEVFGVFLLRPGRIPKTSSGKKQRVELRERLLDGAEDPNVLHCYAADAPQAAAKEGAA